MHSSTGIVVWVWPTGETAIGSSQGKHLWAESPNESLSPQKLLIVSWSKKNWEVSKNNGCWVPANTKWKCAFNRWHSKKLCPERKWPSAPNGLKCSVQMVISWCWWINVFLFAKKVSGTKADLGPGLWQPSCQMLFVIFQLQKLCLVEDS